MGDFVGVQFGNQYDQRQANTLVDILERTFSNISTVFARAKRASYQLSFSTQAVGNIGTGEDTLITYTIPANTLALDGYNFEIKAWGVFAATINLKDLKMYFGNTVIFDTGALTVSGGSWQISATVTRTGDDMEQALASIVSSDPTIFSSMTFTDLNEMLSNDIIVKCTATATTDDDIIQKGFLIKVIPQQT